jgi:class 3 adenylate cyclase
LNPRRQRVYGGFRPPYGIIDALPSLRLRKRERNELLWQVRLVAEVQVFQLRFREPDGNEVLRRMREAASRQGEGADAAWSALLHPKHLADKILSSRSALEGERKQVTVLFADVKGSMELAEQLDPEQWHKITHRFFAILSEGVHSFEGTINPYTGDGIGVVRCADCVRRSCPARTLRGARDAEGIKKYADELRRERFVN